MRRALRVLAIVLLLFNTFSVVGCEAADTETQTLSQAHSNLCLDAIQVEGPGKWVKKGLVCFRYVTAVPFIDLATFCVNKTAELAEVMAKLINERIGAPVDIQGALKSDLRRDLFQRGSVALTFAYPAGTYRDVPYVDTISFVLETSERDSISPVPIVRMLQVSQERVFERDPARGVLHGKFDRNPCAPADEPADTTIIDKMAQIAKDAAERVCPSLE